MDAQGKKRFAWNLPLVVDAKTLPPLKVPSRGTCAWHDRKTDEVLFEAEYRLREEFGKVVLWITYQVPLDFGWKAVHEERLVLIYARGRKLSGFYCSGPGHDTKSSRKTERVFLTPIGIRCRRCLDREEYHVSFFNDEVR